MNEQSGGVASRPHNDTRFRRRSPPGAAPGTLVSDPSAARPRIRLITFGPDQFNEAEIDTPDALPANRTPGTITWIDVCGLGDAGVVTRLGEIFGLHRLALEDALHVHQRPKAEEYGQQLFVVFRALDTHHRAPSRQIALFLGADFVITFQEGAHPGAANGAGKDSDSGVDSGFERVRERLRQGRGQIRNLGADYLAYALVDATIDHYFPVLEAFDDRLDTLTEEVLRQPDSSIVRELHQLKRGLLNLRRIIWASREMINTLLRAENQHIRPETIPYLRDCYDHCIQLMDMLEMQREVSASLFDIYLSSLSNRLNEIMTALTMIATIFIPLGFIASLYGMNFDRMASPWNMPELGWAFGYPFALALMAATAAGIFFWFRRRGWIARSRRRRAVRRESRPAR